MKMRTFDLRMYTYEDFQETAREYVLEEVTHDGQGWFFFSVLENITEENFLIYMARQLVIVFVIDGKARKKIPISKRIDYVESEDAAVILY